MNKLCCQINPLIICKGCNSMWCADHDKTYGWNKIGDSFLASHRYHANLENLQERWDCPVAGIVGAARFSNLDPNTLVLRPCSS